MDVILCLLPLAFLIAVTLVGRIRLPTSTSLPAAAGIMWFIRLAYLASAPNFTNGAIIFGVFDAFTPISIAGGAILLFATMEATECMPWIMGKLKGLSQGHPVAEVFLITWAFEYLIEGASGFGTPIALAAPMMGQLGHDPFNTVVCGLIMNTLATPFGGVGTPIWFGFSGLVPPAEEPAFFQTIAWKVQLIMSIIAHVLPVVAASFLVPLPVLRRSWLFIMLSIWSCVLPAQALAFFTFEFPSLLGGLIGVIVTGILAKFKVGLGPAELPDKEGDGDAAEASRKESSLPGNTWDAASASRRLGLSPSGDLKLAVRSTSASVRGKHKGLTDFPNALNPDLHPAYAKLDYRRFTSLGTQTSEDGLKPVSSHCVPDEEMNEASARDTDVLPPDAAGAPDVAIDLPPGAPGSAFLQVQNGQASESSPSANFSSGQQMDSIRESHESPRSRSLCAAILDAVGRTFPLWGTVLLLIITRVAVFQIKPYLRMKEPYFQIDFQSFGKFRLSASLVVTLADILTEPGLAWSYDILYVPSLIPFVLVGTITVVAYYADMSANGRKFYQPYALTWERVTHIMIPLFGALALVSLIRQAPEPNQSPAYIIGYNLSDALNAGWLAINAFIGALGSFFSGSTTTSNLTFGEVNMIAAANLGLDPSFLLAMQCAGATLGNMICINNIISAKTVMGLMEVQEGSFMAKTGVNCLIALIIATALGALFTYTLPDTLGIHA